MSEFNAGEFSRIVTEMQNAIDPLHAAHDEFLRLEHEINRLNLVIETTIKPMARVTNEWTPITSVEQVEGLANGNYELSNDTSLYPAAAIKHDTVFLCRWITNEGLASVAYHNKEIPSKYDSYKLIRAFKEAAPVIPSGAELERQNAALKEQLSTQPSKAQIAREFVNAIMAQKKHIQSRNWTEAISVVLKEWEAAGEKNA